MIQIQSYAKPKNTGNYGGSAGSGWAGSGASANVTNNYNTIINSSSDDWFYYDSSENSVHCRFPLVGNYEVAAWGLGDSSGSGAGSGCVCDIIDNLYSDSSTSCLSANMGSTLREMVEAISVQSSTGHTHSNLSTLQKITETDLTNWNDASNLRHSHSNKSVLDGISNSSVNAWNNAANNSHSHSNKSALDQIDSNKITQWNTAYSQRHTHSNKTVLDGISQTDVANWDDASNLRHSHTNKGILDGLTNSSISQISVVKLVAILLCSFVCF